MMTKFRMITIISIMITKKITIIIISIIIKIRIKEEMSKIPRREGVGYLTGFWMNGYVHY